MAISKHKFSSLGELSKNLKETATTFIPEAGEMPLLETTPAENIIFKKFLTFMLDDIRYQLSIMAKDKRVGPQEFRKAKVTSSLLASYLINFVEQLDESNEEPIRPN